MNSIDDMDRNGPYEVFHPQPCNPDATGNCDDSYPGTPKNGPSCHVGMRFKRGAGFSAEAKRWLSPKLVAVFGPIVQAVKHRRRYWIHLPEPCSHAYKGWLRGGGLRHRDTACAVPTRCSKSLPPPTLRRVAAYVGACPLYSLSFI